MPVTVPRPAPLVETLGAPVIAAVLTAVSAVVEAVFAAIPAVIETIVPALVAAVVMTTIFGPVARGIDVAIPAVLHEIDRHAAGVVAPAVTAPVAGMAGGTRR